MRDGISGAAQTDEQPSPCKWLVTPAVGRHEDQPGPGYDHLEGAEHRHRSVRNQEQQDAGNETAPEKAQPAQQWEPEHGHYVEPRLELRQSDGRVN